MASLIIQQHPDRKSIEAEAHARPPLDVDLDAPEIWNWTLQVSSDQLAKWPAIFDVSRRHQIVDVEDGRVLFERHTEFVSLMYIGKNAPGTNTLNIISNCPGLQLAGMQVTFSEKKKNSAHADFIGERSFGGAISNGSLSIATTFRSNNDGLVPYVVRGAFDGGYARGELIKQLKDLETYRAAALLAFPLVQAEMSELNSLEERASGAVVALSGAGGEVLGQSIEGLAGLLTEIGALRSRLRYRIAASKAYYQIVLARLESLNEEPIRQRQTLREFIELRLTPAISTIEAFDRRLEQAANTVREALVLARTQLDQITQKNSQKLLRSMEHRARQQVHLAQAVEGLSVAAITYYAVGLISYLLKGLPDYFVSDKVAISISVPIILIVVVILTGKARQHVRNMEKHDIQDREYRM